MICIRRASDFCSRCVRGAARWRKVSVFDFIECSLNIISLNRALSSESPTCVHTNHSGRLLLAPGKTAEAYVLTTFACTLTTAAEAAEHLTMFALTKLGMIPANQDPQLLIRAAITTEKIKDIISTREEGDLVGGDHLLDALINAGTPTRIDGQDPIPPIINFAELLLDESRALDRVIERARAWTRDPEW